jgi:4,5-dihydroxyphthalate decarboxylase
MRKRLTVAGADYDRTAALIDGRIKPEGFELDWQILPYMDIWRRMLNNYEFDVSELSFASYIIARTSGRPLIAIPVFPLRIFRHSYILINTQSGIRAPKGLEGKRVGLAEFQQTATVWVRGMLQHEYGVDLTQIDWFPWKAKDRMEIRAPRSYRIQTLPAGSRPDQMLIDGALDALICSTIFPSLLQGHPNVRYLFEDTQRVEMDYYKKTGIFPIMHTVALREELWRETPEAAVRLYEAFAAAKKLAYKHLDDVSRQRVTLLWYGDLLGEQKNLLGADYWPYGVDKNRMTVQALIDYLFEQELITRRPAVEELFAPNTLDLDG